MGIDKDSATIFIIDNDEAVRRSLERLMHGEGLHAEGFPCARAFLERLPYDGVGCLILELQIPGMNGLELHDKMLSEDISLPVIYLTGHGDVLNSVHAMKRGAVDFLLKPVDDALVVNAISAAILRHASTKKSEAKQKDISVLLSRLSEREREVMEFVISGRRNKQIAGELGITERTVKVHRVHMMEKLGARTVASVVRLCMAAGVEPRKPRTSYFPPTTIGLRNSAAAFMY